MCQLAWIPCNRDHAAEPTRAGGGAVLTAAVGLWTVTKVTYRLAGDFAIGLVVLAIGAYRVARWTARTARRAYRWYVTLPVNRGQRPPVAAVTATTTAPTLADLRLKEPANR